MKKILLSVLVAVGLLVAYVVAGPYLVIHSIKSALINGDSEKLSSNIDFPVLRQNLKDQFNAEVMKKVTEDKDNPFGVLAIGLASKMVDGIVDSMVTPTGLSKLIVGNKPEENSTGSENSAKKDEPFKDAHFSFSSTDTFVVAVPDEKTGEAKFILKRTGLTWKLVNLTLPSKDDIKQ